MSNFEDFGANDWLIEEMRERYQNDPSSVDQAWVDFFRKHAAASSAATAGASTT